MSPGRIPLAAQPPATLHFAGGKRLEGSLVGNQHSVPTQRQRVILVKMRKPLWISIGP